MIGHRYDPRVAVFVALLRGINVGKHRRVAMADLRAALAEAGYADVTTHLQSGNVILETRQRGPDAVARSIEKTLRTGLDLDIDVIVRRASDLAKVAKNNPFLGSGTDPATLHVLPEEETGGSRRPRADGHRFRRRRARAAGWGAVPPLPRGLRPLEDDRSHV